MTSASAPGKVILLGEHAVVYGRPAIAVPLPELRATALVEDIEGEDPSRIRLEAPDLGTSAWLSEAERSSPLAAAVRLGLSTMSGGRIRSLRIRVTSALPPAAGMGSGTAVTTAVLRSLAEHLHALLSDDRLSEMVFEIEKLHHGTPSGIDNTVIVFGHAIYFVRGQPIQRIRIPSPFQLIIGHSGEQSPTSHAVGLVRERWQREPERMEALFDRIGALAEAARALIESGEAGPLGVRMSENHTLLQALGVSSPKIDGLVAAAQSAGALGAKLSGGGLGGIVVALVDPSLGDAVEAALLAAGATQTYRTRVEA